MSSTPPAPPSRWRYLRDGDVLHAAAITLLAVLISGGTIWLAYLIHVWRMAAHSSVETPRRMTVLVFGCRLDGELPSAEFQRRLQRALALAGSGHTDHVVVLGGHSGGACSEAAAGEAWLQSQGLPETVRLEMEQESVDSLENLRQARSLLTSGGAHLTPVALVTSRYHLARCAMLAQRLGFDSVPVAAETELPRHPRYLARLLLESGYVMCMDLALRWAGLLGIERMTARIR